MRAVSYFIATTAAIFWCGTAAASAWYVDNSATGADDGTSWSDAFTDLAQAISNVWGSGENSGATIYVRQAEGAPDYPGEIVIGAGFSDGTPEAYNAIVGWSGEGYLERPTFALETGVLATPYFHTTLGEVGAVSRHYYEFRNIYFAGKSHNFSHAVRLCHNSGNIRFINNESYRAAFSVDDGTNTAKSNIVVRANMFRQSAPCSFRHGYNVTIVSNTFENIGGTRPAIALQYNNADFVITDNDIWAGDGFAIQNTSNVTIERNIIRSTYRAGVWIDYNPGGEWSICNNIFHNTTGTHPSNGNGHGVRISAGSSITADFRIANNTFYNFPSEGACAIKLNQYVKKAVVFNNVISEIENGIIFEDSGSASDYNAFHGVTTTHDGVATLGDHDIVGADPLFRDAQNLDFRLGNDLLRYGGVKSFNDVAAPGVDIYGQTRLGAFSMGAVQSPPGGTRLILR